jgi:hypothetical protein
MAGVLLFWDEDVGCLFSEVCFASEAAAMPL